MRILHLSSECAPWARTGGLGDVVGALPTAQQQADPSAQSAVVMPLYRAARVALDKAGLAPVDTGLHADVHLGPVNARVRFLRLDRPGEATTFFARCDAAYDRDGLYGHDDDGMRFALFVRATLEVAPRLLGGPPDVVHAHDWHAALAPALVRTTFRHHLPHTRTALTIHNLAYQGVFGADMVEAAGLPWEVMQPEVGEFYGHLSFLKAGIALADAVTTVSPTYAQEIRTPAFGYKLDGFLRRFRVHGILNGIDPAVWSPEVDGLIDSAYTADDLAGKAACRSALLKECAWDDAPGVPLLGVVSRMTAQKGLDLIAELVPLLYAMPARLVVLGSGEPGLEERFQGMARHYQHHLRVQVGFDEPLSHRIIAGCDALLVPSRFEPCGLTQLYAMAYGTVPIVHHTGGLADTVDDPGDAALGRGEGTGFVFRHPTTDGLVWAVRRASAMFGRAPDAWQAVQRAGMSKDWSWKRSAQAYLDLYRSLA